MFVVFDLDGTLADCTHRLHYITHPKEPGGDWPKQDWAAFNAACKNDSPIEPILTVARMLIEAGNRVEIWTGRSDDARDDTLAWLRRHDVDVDSISLHMRRQGDYTPDHILKVRWLIERGTPDLIFEDRASVVAMWRSHGIVCAQVAPGEF